MWISRLLHNIRIKRRRNTAIAQACEHSQPSAIAEFLKEYPDQETTIEARAIRECDSGGVWYGLMLALGLIQFSSPRALNVLRRLLDGRYSIPWNRLSEQQMSSIIDYLCNQGALAEVGQLAPHLNKKQIQALRLDQSHPAFLDLLKLLLDLKRPVDQIVDELLEAATKEVTTSLESDSSTFKRCEQASKMLLSEGHVNEALNILTVLSLGGIKPNEAALEQIATSLPNLSDDAIARAGNLFWRYPSQNWISILKDIWLSIADELRYDPEQEIPDRINPNLDAAANAVAVALGACAARDSSYRDFSEDIKLNEEEPDAIEKYNHTVTEYNQLIKQYRSSSSTRKQQKSIEERLKALKPQLENQSRFLKQQFKNEHSPGYLLLQVLRSSHIYPVSARQSAAWGLHLLRTHGHLKEETKNELFVALCEVNSAEDDQFRERHVRFLPGGSVLELTEALRNGLQWMSDLIEGEYSTSPHLEQANKLPDEFPRLQEIVSLIYEMLPGALNFLQHYPLRLMPLSYHKKLLGQYSKTGGSLVYWTRYTPPKDVGPVHMRYIGVEDRSTPNSMGIYYKLFSHPVLALPVIYHEFMHYGGPKGDPSQGIANETEVLLRELLFARYLIAQLAPPSDHELPAFEESLVQEIKRSELESLQWQLVHNFSDDMVLAHINREVIELYGEQLSDDEVEERLAQQMIQENLGIKLQNILLTWNPEITWPQLGSPKTKTVINHYREMHKRLWTRWHRVNPLERDSLLRSDPCLSQVMTWERYINRKYALQHLVPSPLADLDYILWLIVRRFDLNKTNGRDNGNDQEYDENAPQE